MPAGALPPQPKMMRSASCSAAASTIPSAACRPMRTIGWMVVPVGRVVEHPLEQPPGLAGPRRALGQRHPLRDLDDAQRRQLAGPRVEHRRADADQLLGGARVGDRDEDARAGQRAHARAHAATSASARVPALDEVRLEQLELAGLALDPLLRLVGRHVAVLDDEAADPPEVDRHERRDQRLERGLRVACRDDEVVDDPRPQVVREVERADRLGHLQRGGRGRRHVAADAELGPRRVAEPAGLGRELHHRRSAVAGASIACHMSARVSEPAWNSDSSRSVFTSSGGGSMIRSKP